MLITFIVLPFYWIRALFLRRFGSQNKKDAELKMYPRHYLGFRNIKVEVVGNIDYSSPNMYVCNHQSQNDIFVTLDAIKEPFRFIAKKELFESFITGVFMKLSDSYPLDREDARKSLTILKEAVEDVKAGHSLLAFPEGTRSYQKDLLPFKDGIFSMLRKSKADFVPMYIKESYNEKQDIFYVYVGDPIKYPEYKEYRGSALSDYIREKMNELKDLAYKKS